MNKLRVGVLMGGRSVEREVSFNSGRTVCDHLDTTRYDIVPIFQHHSGTLYIIPWRFLHRGKTADFVNRLAQEGTVISWDNLSTHVDFVYLALHGRYAEDGTIQAMLELLNIPYLGTKRLGSALCMDKIMLKKFLKIANVDTARSIAITPDQVDNYREHAQQIQQQLLDNKISFPCVVKPYKEGSSLGITIVFKEKELAQALHNACYIQPGIKQTVMIEEKIEGMEFSCIILTDYKTGNPILLPPTEIVPEDNAHFYDYEQKYMPGRALEFTPARTSDENIQKIQQACLATMKALSIKNFGRIDGFLTKDNRVVILDPNTITGMGPATFLFREAAEYGMSHTTLINHLIETELYQNKRFASFVKELQKKDQKVKKNKLRVAVIFGGSSNEKEISLESGRNICYKLSPEKYSVIPLFLNKKTQLHKLDQRLLLRNSTQEIELELTSSTHVPWNELSNLADFVFLGLHGGAGENGIIQGTLELLGLPYNGSSVLASSLCMDKYKTNELLQKNGFDTPKALLIDVSQWNTDSKIICEQIIKNLSLPVIVKPHDDGCSVGVCKANNLTQLKKHINELFAIGKTNALIEECISGMELTIGIIGNNSLQALPPSQAVTHNDILSIQEKFLPGAGENQTPAPLTPHATKLVQETTQKAFDTIGCSGYARIDCFYQTKEQSPTNNERVIILEINTLPALTPATCLFHQAAEIGIKPMEFIDTIIQLGMQLHGKAEIQPMPQKPKKALLSERQN